MQIKKFEALNMQEAVRLIKGELGPDALILSTKKIKKGGSVFGLFSRSLVEVTAATDFDQREKKREKSGRCEEPAEHKRTASRPNLEPLQEDISEIREDVRSLMKLCSISAQDKDDNGLKDEIVQVRAMMAKLIRQSGGASLSHLHENYLDLYRRLLVNSIDDQVSLRLIEAVSKKIKTEDAGKKELIEERLSDILMRNIKVTGPIINGDKRKKLALFMGPTGVGKTTTIAKLAALYAIKDKKKVGLITLDTYRIGAIEQLKIYAKIIGIPVDIAFSGRELAELAKEKDADLVLIDTAGRSQRDSLQMSELKEVFKYKLPIESYLLLSATTKERDLNDIIDKFRSLPVDRLIFTKLDETTTFGPLLNAMIRSKKPISYLTTGQRVPEDIEVATSKKITGLILGNKEV